MATTELKYGDSHFFFEFDDERFRILENGKTSRALTDLEIGEKLNDPLGSPMVEEFVEPGEKVLVVVPDATREVACGQVINVVVRRLIANGTAPFDINIIFATGIHRRVTDDEKRAILTPFIAQRIKTLDHSPRDIAQLVRLGETSDGIPIELNRALVDNQKIILIGGIAFHYFAGFTGGRKLICPGLASSRTISATHRLAFDCERKTRRDGVGTALLDGNAVHEAFVEAASAIKPVFCISTFVNNAGELTDLICGDLIGSHRKACDVFSADNSLEISEKRGAVVASCGGLPYDINLIQAHKTLDAASWACLDGGTIILLAECSDGLGRADFLKWFDAKNSSKLADILCEGYQVNGQTAWNLMKITERFQVRIVTELSNGNVEKLGMKHCQSLADALKGVDPPVEGYIVPAGSRIRIVTDSK
jgi:lactate racemase